MDEYTYSDESMPMSDAERYFEICAVAKGRQDSLNGLYEYILRGFNDRFEVLGDDAAQVPEFIWETLARTLVWLGDGA